ncbi:hypothetical protein Cyast_1717 [Cyanobacterium stanieri PCC 7202]|uniref:Uncharacterized protein n=1 Tax=Cyanobacterium stanieri (strain ATCC 29140 / PCC 7202) TaxID=292563 RepID=K9YNL6_CYASC|nr:hypothetical protein Cyast_1717 [Cyanobacterium stanieri PCC 7202]
MSKQNIKNKGKTAIIIASVTGLTVAGGSGLLHQLTSVLDSVMVSSAHAQIREIDPAIRTRAVPLDNILRQTGGNSIAVQDGRAIVLFDGGRQTPLQDGAYTNNNIIFTVENGIVTSCDGCGGDDGGDDEPLWLQYCPGGRCPDEPEGEIMPRGNVRDSLNQVTPTEPMIEPNDRITPQRDLPGLPNRSLPERSF